MSKLYGTTMLWTDVPVLEPLQQAPDQQGNVLLRVNALHCRKLRGSKHCMIEVSACAYFMSASTHLCSRMCMQ